MYNQHRQNFKPPIQATSQEDDMDNRKTEILNKIKLSKTLPSPKGIALEVINLTQRESTTSHEVVRLISADPVLSMRVIKAAGFLMANPYKQILSIPEAVAILGFSPLRQLVLCISLITEHKHGPCKQFDYHRFWSHSLLTGIAARHLIMQSKLAPAEEIFTLGLLGSVGQLVLASVFPEEFGSVLELQNKLPLDALYGMEREKFGIEEAELSAAILEDMCFPALFQRLVHDFPQPENSSLAEGSREWKLMNMLHMASQIADVIWAGQSEDFQIIRQLREHAAMLDIQDETLFYIAEKCTAEWPEWAALLDVKSHHAPSFATLFELDNQDRSLKTSASG
jgi:HD-like signal output (HDOD) protein